MVPTKTISLIAATVFAALTLTTGAVQASQKSKNTWRNATAGSAALLGYGLLTHNKTATVLGAAGTAYSANRYEQDRHHQSQRNSWRSRYYRHSSQRYYSYHGHEYRENTRTGHRYFVK